MFEVDRVVVVNDHTEMFAAETHGAQTLDSTLCGGSVGKDRGDVIVAQMGVELLGVHLCSSHGRRLTSMVRDGSTRRPGSNGPRSFDIAANGVRTRDVGP
jgi:hypothetical protein